MFLFFLDSKFLKLSEFVYKYSEFEYFIQIECLFSSSLKKFLEEKLVF